MGPWRSRHGSTISGCGSVTVNTATGKATCQETLTTGPHGIVAAYVGDTRFAASHSPLLTETEIGSTPTAITLQAYPNPASPGQDVTFTATVAPSTVVSDGLHIGVGWVRNTPGCDMWVGICQICVAQGYCELGSETWSVGGWDPYSTEVYLASNGSFTFEAMYTDTGSPQPPYTVNFLPSTSASYIETVGTSTTTVRPGQTTITTGPCTYNCTTHVSAPASVPTPAASRRAADDGPIGAVDALSPGSGTPTLFIVPSAPLSQPAATKIANTLQRHSPGTTQRSHRPSRRR